MSDPREELIEQMRFARDEARAQRDAAVTALDLLATALELLADPENWSGDPGTWDSRLYGHFTPFEVARRALAAVSGSDEPEGDKTR